ncbi:MAG: hypothetical protein EON92_14830 [Burkholderiales bacterium]|nr:MAG: hypothetical protein EON92_14830 [Burkholderiales bacterium]
MLAEQALDELNASFRVTPRSADAAAANIAVERLAETARNRLRALTHDAERRAACLRSVAQALRYNGELEHADLAGPLARDVQTVTLARRAGLLTAEPAALANALEAQLDAATPMQHALLVQAKRLRATVKLAGIAAQVRGLAGCLDAASENGTAVPQHQRDQLLRQLGKAELQLSTFKAAYRRMYPRTQVKGPEA